MFPAEAKILIVDDSNFTRSVLKESLRHMKFTKIIEAVDAMAAQKLMLEPDHQKDPIHLLISDLHMPEMTGIDLIRWVRTQPQYKALPVIILTTVQEKNGILEAGKLGVSHYMIKPFDLGTLKERMQSTWDKHGEKYFAANRKV